MVKTFLEIPIDSINAIGIDVSALALDICIIHADCQCRRYLKIRNNEADVIELIKSLSGYGGKTIMESTGRHHLLLAITLAEKGFDARVINPLLARKHISGDIRKVKTDKHDSRKLATMAFREDKLPQPFSAGRKALNIRKKLGLIASLDKQLQQLSAMTSDYVKTKESLRLSLSSSEKQVLNIINKLKQQKQKLEREVERDIKNLDDDDNDRIGRYQSIPGVSLFIASLGNFFFSLDYLETPKQWIAYSGLDVSVRESGSWKGRGKLTKRGNSFVRKKLFQAAWGAVMNNPQFNQYYYCLKANGRSHKEALVIIARKLVRIMFSLAKNQTTYDPSKLVFNI
jgi:transposase